MQENKRRSRGGGFKRVQEGGSKGSKRLRERRQQNAGGGWLERKFGQLWTAEFLAGTASSFSWSGD